MQDTPLNRLAAELQALAEEKGFRENIKDPKSQGAIAIYVANFHGEASELWEAARAGKLHEPCDKAAKMREHGTGELTCIEEELADMFIRTLDIGNVFGVDIDSSVHAYYVKQVMNELALPCDTSIDSIGIMISKFHLVTSWIISDGKNIENRLYHRMGVMLSVIMHIADSFGVDIFRAVRLKHAFNKTRPYRHGGKLA